MNIIRVFQQQILHMMPTPPGLVDEVNPGRLGNEYLTMRVEHRYHWITGAAIRMPSLVCTNSLGAPHGSSRRLR